MNKRDAKFVSRIILLSMTALAFSVGARIILENEQLTKAIPRTNAREFMLVFGPLVSLMGIHYTLAVKSFGIRSLKTEAMVYVFCASIFLAVTLAYFFGQSVEVALEDCPWWRFRSCDGIVTHQANYFWSPIIALVGLGSLFLA